MCVGSVSMSWSLCVVSVGSVRVAGMKEQSIVGWWMWGRV